MKESSFEYLVKVLHWKRFCITHKKLDNAIREILLENFLLKIRLSEYECKN